MKSIYYEITVPVGEIQPPPEHLGFMSAVVPADLEDWYVDKKLRDYFVRHFTREFERLYDRDTWITRKQERDCSPLFASEHEIVTPREE
jgi:hypothetical protein